MTNTNLHDGVTFLLTNGEEKEGTQQYQRNRLTTWLKTSEAFVFQGFVSHSGTSCNKGWIIDGSLTGWYRGQGDNP